ncbi:MAG: hypothetical protein U9Q19_10435, partial [Pseudomonadota bacterium]|nr:hypothetical protein [Pseudomonadota bacterium]
KTNAKVADYEVKSTPGPRFWQPNEPVLLIAGESAQLTPRHGEDGLLDCTLTHLPEGPLEDCLDKLATTVQQAADQQDPEQHHCCEQPWHPFLLEWCVDVHPLINESNLDASSRAYQPSFIDSNYKFPTDRVDLFLRSPNPQAFSDHANHYTGRTILTPYASTQLRIQLETFLKKQLLPSYYKANDIPPEKRDDDSDELFTKVISWYETATSYQDEVTTALVNAYQKIYDDQEEDHRFRVMTQSLGGFNEALLQHKQTLQLPIDDPLGFAHDRAFANRVRAGVGNMNRSAPQPNNQFMPIRAGLLKLNKLRLVDTFGRVQKLKFDPKKVITTEAMTVGKIPDLIHLRPCITQPARLNLRWLSAASDNAGHHDEPESSSHPGTTPVCGWVLPNHLDQSLMIYANDGKPLGSIGSEDGRTVWRGAPGEVRISQWQISNPHLCRLVCHLMEQDIAIFLSRLDDQLECIDPQWFAQHQALSVIMGRPLAVSRVRLGLELRGLPAINQHDSVFLQDMQKDANAGREHDHFTAVRFPVRLGNHGQLNDGLAAYWREKQGNDGSCCLTGEAHYSDEATPIELTLHDAPQTLTLLIDPRAVLHATTGILPTKAINIPHEQYADVLKRLNITFRTAPVLSPRADLRLPLPEEPGHSWSWLENIDGNWQSSDTIGRPKLDAHWGESQEILEGWLKLSERNTE